ncbi:hypothetical protein GMORB2_3452 [Geosmithia morbida]|uniref:Uncharacterized protein n=1 Tax=Geosmithia morbida TaxID=1094350 RepID=A0A9P4YR25_9HYPO|nr:uncharacterized protein GMORB2_3452 [Geosmithia morbida]KAF4120041.1 hypothetical protein GMORB2_3452 [Geosmithia morbida]
MGLPLFVAPVASDLTEKVASKDAESRTSPRSSIRRLAQDGASRERASSNRRARTLEHHRERLQGLPGSGAAAAPARPITSMVAPQDRNRIVRYIRQGFMTPEDVTHGDRNRERQRYSLIQNMELRFGPDWRDRDWNSEQQDAFSDWWLLNVSNGRACLMRRQGPSQWRAGTNRLEIVPSASWADVQPGGGLSAPLPPSRAVPPSSSRRPLPTDVGGLGDRDRSLSPEGWDTLLTTLTPDPQPPSVNSSFASSATATTATHPSNPTSSRTSLSGQPPTTTAAADADPGCETGGSDAEENGVSRHLERIQQALLFRPSSERRIPRPVESPAFSPVRNHVSDRAGSDEDSSTTLTLQRPADSVHHSLAARTERRGDDYDGHDAPSFPRPGIWVGRLSIGASDDEQPAAPEHLSVSREDSGDSSFRSDSDLAGMQRIMRSLAARGDIPDEWWAEAGLSRSLSRGGRD